MLCYVARTPPLPCSSPRLHPQVERGCPHHGRRHRRQGRRPLRRGRPAALGSCFPFSVGLATKKEKKMRKDLKHPSRVRRSEPGTNSLRAKHSVSLRLNFKMSPLPRLFTVIGSPAAPLWPPWPFSPGAFEPLASGLSEALSLSPAPLHQSPSGSAFTYGHFYLHTGTSSCCSTTVGTRNWVSRNLRTHAPRQNKQQQHH